MGDLEDDLDVPVEYGEIVSHNASHAIVNFARHDEADLLVTAGEPVDVGGRLRGRDVEWIASHAPCDLLLVDTDRLGGETVALVTDQGPFGPLKVQVADAIATATDAEVELVHALQADTAEGRADTVDGYHDDLAELFSVPVSSTTLDDADPETVASAVDAGLVIVGNDDSAVVRQLDDRQPDEIVEEVESGAVVVRPHGARQPNLLSRLVERLAF